jgi:hypothetical protein
MAGQRSNQLNYAPACTIRLVPSRSSEHVEALTDWHQLNLGSIALGSIAAIDLRNESKPSAHLLVCALGEHISHLPMVESVENR